MVYTTEPVSCRHSMVTQWRISYVSSAAGANDCTASRSLMQFVRSMVRKGGG